MMIILAVQGVVAFVLGTLAYVIKSRQLRRLGQKPPPFLMFVFFPRGVPQGNERVSMPRLLRVLLGIIFLPCGAFFALAGILLLIIENHGPHPFVLAALVLGMVGIGSGIGFVGFRLIVVTNDEPLFKWRSKDAPGRGQR